MSTPPTQLSLSFELSPEPTSGPAYETYEPVVSAERPDLAPRALKARSESLENWHRWWRSSGCLHAIGDVDALVEYARHLEQTEKSAIAVNCAFHWISEWLEAARPPDPTALRLAEQIKTSARHTYEHALRQAPSIVFGREDVDALIAAADPLSPQDCRDLSALLLLYETMAAPDQIFGYEINGRRQAPPIHKDALSFHDDGTAKIELKAISKNLGRTAVLSSEAASWLRRWLESRTDSRPELFVSRNGPFLVNVWRTSVKDMALRAGFPTPFRLRGLRRGRAHEMLVSGVKAHDVLRVTSWRSMRPIRAAQQAIIGRLDSRNCSEPALRSLSFSSRRPTRMRAYSSDLFADAQSR
jgi:integrase